MSRLVRYPPAALAGDEVEDTYKDKLERLAKYVPSEVLATYIFLNGIAATAASHTERLLWFSISFLICLSFTPIYFYLIRSPGDAVRHQQITSTIAFIIWAYGLGAGLFKEADYYFPIAAAFAVAIFSLVSAFIVPKPR
jgi:predicted membrane channel-forming protein YqfA (hemolysin III family)